MHEGEDMAPKSVELRETDAGLTLVGDNMELRCDFEEMLPRIKPGRLQQELLVKAAKVKGTQSPTAIDCTAGFGQDSFLLAAAGFTVRMFERDETIAALLEDGLSRAGNNPVVSGIAKRMSLERGDSLQYLAALVKSGEVPPAVI